MFEGNNTIQTYAKEILIDESKTLKDYNLQFKKNETKIINITFSKVPDENVKIMYGEKDVECELKNLTMECKLDNNTFDLNENDMDKYNTFKLKIVDLCGTEKYTFNVNINSEKKESNKEKGGNSVLTTVILIVAIVIGVLVVLLIAFLIYRKAHKKDGNIEKETIGEKEPDNNDKLMSDY